MWGLFKRMSPPPALNFQTTRNYPTSMFREMPIRNGHCWPVELVFCQLKGLRRLNGIFFGISELDKNKLKGELMQRLKNLEELY